MTTVLLFFLRAFYERFDDLDDFTMVAKKDTMIQNN